MTWTKHGDDHADRLWSLSNAAYRLHDHGLIYCNRLGTDGRLSADRLPFLAPLTDQERATALTELEAFGLWLPEPGGYVLTDFAGDQPTAEVVALRRQIETVRKAWGRAKKAGDEARVALIAAQLGAMRATLAELTAPGSGPASVPPDVARDVPVMSQEGNPLVPGPTRPDPTRPDRVGVGPHGGSTGGTRERSQGGRREKPESAPVGRQLTAADFRDDRDLSSEEYQTLIVAKQQKLTGTKVGTGPRRIAFDDGDHLDEHVDDQRLASS